MLTASKLMDHFSTMSKASSCRDVTVYEKLVLSQFTEQGGPSEDPPGPPIDLGDDAAGPSEPIGQLH